MSTKVVLLGDSGVGKSLFLHAATNAKPESVTGSSIVVPMQSTIGVDFISTTRPLPNNEYITLSVWDTAGQEKFQAVSACYMRGASAIMLFYAVNDRTSFTNVARRWAHKIHDTVCHRRPPPIFLVATKCDLPADEQLVSDDEAELMCRRVRAAGVLRTSAVSNNGNYARTTLNIVAAHLVRTGYAFADSAPGKRVRPARRADVVILESDGRAIASNASRRCAC